MGGVPPFLLRTDDNPEGVDASVFEGIQKGIVADRYVFFTEFFKKLLQHGSTLG
jgi:non-heme chloroperoxidase